MSDMRNFSRAFVEEFIEIYRSHECLWKIKSQWYSDREKKRSAYEKLIEKMREVDLEADRDAVVKKINNLRSAYRKELKKVSDSKKSGSGADNIYTPRLWYFNILSFLMDQETPRASTSNLDRFEDQEPEESIELDLPQDQELQEQPEEEQSRPPSVQSVQSPNTSGQTRPRKRRKEDPTNHVMSLVAERIQSNKTEDDSDITGKYIASKLRTLSRDQRIYAERLITEVLFEAQLGNLNRECKLTIQNSQTIAQNPTCTDLQPM